ncbi:hypothetical protein HBB16_13375 [Pseudonocardia sp. MCCB 268]|nr:hypothetical protein [Pseudonocardia cytotoxica]
MSGKRHPAGVSRRAPEVKEAERALRRLASEVDDEEPQDHLRRSISCSTSTSSCWRRADHVAVDLPDAVASTSAR